MWSKHTKLAERLQRPSANVDDFWYGTKAWPWTLTSDLQNLTRSSEGDDGYTLYASSRLLK